MATIIILFHSHRKNIPGMTAGIRAIELKLTRMTCAREDTVFCIRDNYGKNHVKIS